MEETVGDLVGRAAEAALIGRDSELSSLSDLLSPEGPVVAFVHGPAGIGKSALLAAFAGRTRAAGRVCVQIDCGTVEPTPAGLLAALACAAGLPPEADVAEVTAATRERPHVLILDRYERFRLLDTWFRQSLLPAMGAGIRVVIASREPPLSPWWSAPGWSEIFLRLPLGPLPPEATELLLARHGIEGPATAAVARLARGHPLALVLAGAGGTAPPDGSTSPDAALERVISGLLAAYLDDLEPATRRVVEAASVVRRVTLPLLDALIPDATADHFERLRRLPFVEATTDGLALHETIQQAVVASLRSADPVAWRTLHRRAWTTLRRQLATAAPHDLWRYTADMLWLITNPVIREAFFPSVDQRLVVEPAAPGDESEITAMVRLHEAAPEPLEAWWRELPGSFHVARDPSGEIAGFYVLAEASDVTPVLLQRDVLVRRWLDHLDRQPVPNGQRTLLLRRWLDRVVGDAPSAAQGACWLDVKRVYLEMRPQLRRIYTTTTSPEQYLPVVTRLGFEPIPEAAVSLGGAAHASVVLDFGPSSVDGWLTRLAAQEIGAEEDRLLDPLTRALDLGGDQVPLTRLEFGLLSYLTERPGHTVSREELLSTVWGYDQPVGSNVVDAVVRSLRRKLGRRAAVLVTVRGHGYRFDP